MRFSRVGSARESMTSYRTTGVWTTCGSETVTAAKTPSRAPARCHRCDTFAAPSSTRSWAVARPGSRPRSPASSATRCVLRTPASELHQRPSTKADILTMAHACRKLLQQLVRKTSPSTLVLFELTFIDYLHGFRQYRSPYARPDHRN